MFDKPAYYPHSSTSARPQQQELQLRQFTLAAMSARERDGERARLSPEPRLEMMRPVSPFQNKRPFAHQQAQTQVSTQTQPQRERQAFNSHYQTRSNSQPSALAKPQNTTNLRSSSRVDHASSRARLNGHRTDSRGTRSTQRDADISPALKMMNYDTSLTPSLSDQGNGRVSANTPISSGTLAPPDRSDMNRSTSPEGRRKNPGWRKPVPKYIPTPPTTPPTATFERLPSSRDREESIPPVPLSSTSATNVRPTRQYAAPIKAYTDPTPPTVSHAPPPRPARATTDHQVPVMFRDLMTSRARMATIQQPAQAHVHQASSVTSMKAAYNLAPPPRVQRESSSTSQVQAPAAPQEPSQAHSTQLERAMPSLAVRQSHSSNLRTSDMRTESQRSVLVHPQPRKVPSMAQLVAMVLPSRSSSRTPSRTPSPGVPLTTLDISEPLTQPSVLAVQASTIASTVTPQTTVPSLSIDPPSPVGDKKRTSTLTFSGLSDALLQPDQVQLPPSGHSSARSSRSVSPQPSPRRATAPLPVRSRSRSPTPAVIPQYAPPPPPFPPPPPNTPIATLKPRASALLQPLLSSRLAEKAEAAVTEAPASRVQAMEVVPTATEERIIQLSARKHSPPNRSANIPTSQATQNTKEYVEMRAESAPPIDPSRRSPELVDAAVQAPQVADVSAKERPFFAPTREDATPVQMSEQMNEVPQFTNVHIRERPSLSSVREQTPPSRKAGRLTAQVNDRATPAPRREQHASSGDLEQTLVKQITEDEGKEQLSLTSAHEPSPRPRVPRAETTQIVQQVSITAQKRPAPMSMSDHAQVSRESGLVTPPDTPPGTVVSKPNTNDELDWSRRVGYGDAEQKFDANIESLSRAQVSNDDVLVSKAIERRETPAQNEQTSWDDEKPVKVVSNTPRLVTPILMWVPPTAVASNILRESPTPPSTKLPVDWKETITRVVHTTASPNPPIPSQQEASGNPSVLPPMRPTAQLQSQPAKADDVVAMSRTVVRGASMEQAEHATTARELHIHEAKTDAEDIFQSFEKSPFGNKVEFLQASRSPRRKATALEVASTAALQVGVDKQPTHDSSPASNTSKLSLPEPPVRSRSPVPLRKAPQEYLVATNVTEERTDAGSIVATAAEKAPAFSSVSHAPTARSPAELSTRSHSSGSKRKVKTTRARPHVDHDGEKTVQTGEHPVENFGRSHHADDTEHPSAPTDLQAATKGFSPPPRYQSLGSRKRLPLNGSESSLAQSQDNDVATGHPSSPPVTVRSLSPTAQPQPPPPKPPRHAHGQHKRLPAPEVTQQAYRPPTPPIPSHYRKKRSNDMLPQEPPTFMKPAVHVIYPDTSTSHGHSLSGESVLNMSSSRPLNTNYRTQPPSSSHNNEERARTQSPSVASQERDDNEDDELEDYPQVPPKACQPEMNGPGSSSGYERLSNFSIQHATRGHVRYPSAPVGLSRAHILTLPPSSNNSRNHAGDHMERAPSSNLRPRRTQKPHATKAARSQSEKVLRKKENVQPMARSRSTPLPSSRQRNRNGFWRMFGLWARVFIAKFKTWTSPAPSPSHSSEYGEYYDTY